MGAGVVERPYGRPADFEADVIRRNVPWLTAGTKSPSAFRRCKSQGIITPNGLFFERHHAGRPDIDPDQHRLMIHGLVERPLVFTMKDIMRFPHVADPFHRMPGQWRHGVARGANRTRCNSTTA